MSKKKNQGNKGLVKKKSIRKKLRRLFPLQSHVLESHISTNYCEDTYKFDATKLSHVYIMSKVTYLFLLLL